MPVPTSQKVFSYAAVEQPVVSSDPAQAKPIGVGSVAIGGDTVDVNVNVGQFAGPVNVSFMIYAPTLESDDLYFMGPNNEIKKLSNAVEEDEDSRSGQGDSCGEYRDADHGSKPSTKFSRLIRWKDNVTGVNQSILTAPVGDLRSGIYTLVLVVKSTEDHNDYYRWVTQVTIPQSNDSDEDHDEEDDD
jgi:hypothetical protein